MKTIEIQLYKFDELSEAAQNVAIQENEGINVDFQWWDSTYEGANNIGLSITSFGLDRNRHAEGKLEMHASSAAFLILENHGETCGTYNTASIYLNTIEEIESKYPGGTDEDDYNIEEETEEAKEEFLNSLLEDYSIMLQNESEYLQSDEAIKETIIANDYDFTENGKMY
jgi:hypothetical protein